MQELRPGSYIRVPGDAALAPQGDFTLQMWICPTLAEKPLQTIISNRGADGSGFALRLEDGRLTLRLGDEAVAVDQPVRASQWYFVSAALRRHRRNGTARAGAE